MAGIFDQIINYSPPQIVAGVVNYNGTWNATSNTPTLNNPPASTTKGDYYVVSVAGTQFSLSFAVGDWIISNGTAWEKVDLTDAVSSVFNRTGAVVGVSTDYSSVGITGTAIGASSPSTGAFTTLTATGDASIGTNTFKIDSTNTRILLGLASALQGDTLEIQSKGDGGAISLFGRATDNRSAIRFRANGSNTQKGVIQCNDTQLEIIVGSLVALTLDSSQNATLAGNLTVSGAGDSSFVGNVGIGTTGPGTKLEVAGEIRAYSAGAVDDQNISVKNGSRQWNMVLNGTSSKFWIKDVTANLERLTIDTNGNVGIGTTGPTSKLHVKDAVGGEPSLNYADSSAALISGPYTALSITAQAGAPFGVAIQTRNANSDGSSYNLAINPLGGNVGIGTTSPGAYKLNVQGDGLYSGNLTVSGALSKGSGSFRIDHPLPAKKDTHRLVHSFIEGPKADLIYRGKVTLVNGAATINIDEVATMTAGTFVVLCRDVQCYTSNESDWSAVRGSVTGNILTIQSEDAASTANVSWLVIGERQDPHIMETDWTDDNGKVIVEPLKEIVPEVAPTEAA